MAAYGVTPWRGVLGRGIAISDLKDPVQDLADLTVSLRVDGQPVDTARGDTLLGNPLDVVLWLVEHGGYELKPGSVISLGSLGSLHPAHAGQRIAAVYRVGGRTMEVDLSLVP